MGPSLNRGGKRPIGRRCSLRSRPGSSFLAREWPDDTVKDIRFTPVCPQPRRASPMHRFFGNSTRFGLAAFLIALAGQALPVDLRGQSHQMEKAEAGLLEAGSPLFTVLSTESLGLNSPPTDLHLMPDGRVSVVGGMSSSGTVLRTAEIWSPTTNQWSMLPNMASTRAYHSAVEGRNTARSDVPLPSKSAAGASVGTSGPTIGPVSNDRPSSDSTCGRRPP